LTRDADEATLGAISVRKTITMPRTWRALRWDAVAAALVWFAVSEPVFGRVPAGRQSPVPAVQVQELLRQDGIVLSRVQPIPAQGLAGSRLRIERAGRVSEAPLDGTVTGRRARSIGAVRMLPESHRALLLLDPEHDASGLLVVDLETATIVDAVTARDFVPSPDGRFWAFEEHAVRTLEQWPHTETVYAVYDAAAPPAANARPCPSADERCRGQVLFLPDRLALCRQVAAARGGPCLTPGRQPRHARRSPFVWLSATELAWVDVDLVRQDATLVIATVRGGGPASVLAVPLERQRVIEEVDVPPVREAWTIESITRDADPSRVWLQFRNPLPQAPQRRLGIRIS
jgi:hypothetical protein